MPMTRALRAVSPSVTGSAPVVFRALCLALVSLSGAACRHAGHDAPRVMPGSGGEGDPCRGTQLKLNGIAELCEGRARSELPPPVSSLRMELSPSPVVIRSGEETTVTVVMTNLTSAPLDLDLMMGCKPFEQEVYREGEEERVNLETTGGCALTGGICAPGLPVVLILEPHGVLRTDLTFTAHVVRREHVGNQCVTSRARVLPPGRYRLRVQQPFWDPVPGQPQVRKSRWAEAPVVVQP